MNSKLLGALIGSLLLSSCLRNKPEEKPYVYKELPMPTMGQKPKPAVAATPEAEKLSPELEKGKLLYVSNCLQCHNRDPNVKGAVGPEIIDAPLEVMTSKVMTSKYPAVLPPGFVPKRKTQAMRAIPKLKDDIPLIWAYVQSVKKNK